MTIDSIYGHFKPFEVVFFTTSVFWSHHPWCASPSVVLLFYNAIYSVYAYRGVPVGGVGGIGEVGGTDGGV